MAAQIFPFGTPLTVVWHLTKPDGTAFNLDGYSYRAYYRTGNKETEATSTHLTASGNTLSITIPADEPVAPGEYALRLVLFQNGNLFCTLNYNAAFVLSRQLGEYTPVENQEEAGQTVHLYTVAQYYLLAPIVPTVGNDGYWYVNGAKITDGNGEYIPSSHTVRYDSTTKYLIIDEGRVDKNGNSIQQTITDIATAITAADDAATNANAKAGLANDAATLANTKAGLANDAATLANSKAGLANDAATLANGKAELADTKAGLADAAATRANTAAAAAEHQVDVKRGYGIDSVTEPVVSTVNGGTNTIRVTTEDGKTFDFYVRNGKSDAGFFATSTALSSTIPSPNVGDYAFVSEAGDGTFPAYIYVCTTAGTWTATTNEFTPDDPTDVLDVLNSSSTTAALSANQGKVLDEKITQHFYARADFVGEGSTSISSNKFANIIPLHTYRFHLNNWQKGATSTLWVFSVNSYDSSDNATTVLSVRGDEQLSSFYDVQLPSNSVSFYIQARIAEDVSASCLIEDVTDSLAAQDGVWKTKQNPTALTKLQIKVDTLKFASTTSGAVRLYYVPCSIGDYFLITATGSSEATFRYGFSANIPASDGDLISAKGFSLSSVYLKTESAPANGYFSVYCNATTFPDVTIYKLAYTPLGDNVRQNTDNIEELYSKTKEARQGFLGSVEIVGADTTMVSSDKLTDVIVGHTYRFYLNNWTFGHTGSYHVFEAVAVDNVGTETVLVYERGDAGTAKAYYETTIPSGTVALIIKGRVASPNIGVCYIDDVTAIYNKSIHLDICILGNSYSADAWRYVPRMLLDYGITCNIDFYYRGSGSLHDLDEQWLSDSAKDISYEDGREHSRFHFAVDSREIQIPWKWKVRTIMSAHDIVALRHWDIITLQQRGNGGYSADIQYYEPYLQNVLKKIYAICNYPVNLWWFNSYNGVNDDGATMNAASMSVQGQVYHSYPFDDVIPAGTAVFNARLNSTLSALGDSTGHKLMAEDNIHLQEGLPCYITALTVVQAILDKYKPGATVFGNTFRATAANIEDCGMDVTANGESTGVTDDNCYLAQKAAIVARNSPFTIIGI